MAIMVDDQELIHIKYIEHLRKRCIILCIWGNILPNALQIDSRFHVSQVLYNLKEKNCTHALLFAGACN